MGFGNFSVFVPEERRASGEAEMAAQGGVAFDAKQFLDVSFGEFHDVRESRPLDPAASSTLSQYARNVSNTMDTMAERLAHALRERKMTPMDLKRSTELSKAAIYFLLNGTTKPEKVRADLRAVLNLQAGAS